MPGRGQIVGINGNLGHNLVGSNGEYIGADQGWHAIWVDNADMTVWDNAGNQGPLGNYIDGIRHHNSGPITLKPLNDPPALEKHYHGITME